MTNVRKSFEDEKNNALKEKEKSMVTNMLKININIDEKKILSMCEFLSLTDIPNIVNVAKENIV